MMVDSIFSYLGSANLNSRSMRYDYECNLLVADKHTTKELQDLFKQDKLLHCFKMTPETHKKFSTWRKFKGWLFHFLSPFVYEEPKQKDLLHQHFLG
jgi:cardiolipin synthase